jgi:hypothetical protein
LFNEAKTSVPKDWDLKVKPPHVEQFSRGYDYSWKMLTRDRFQPEEYLSLETTDSKKIKVALHTESS